MINGNKSDVIDECRGGELVASGMGHLTKYVAFSISLTERDNHSLFPLKLNLSWPLAKDAELWALEVYDEHTLFCRVDLHGKVEFVQPDCEERVVQILISGLTSMQEQLGAAQKERDCLQARLDEWQEDYMKRQRKMMKEAKRNHMKPLGYISYDGGHTWFQQWMGERGNLIERQVTGKGGQPCQTGSS